MNRQIAGHTSADYLWSVKAVVPFVKVDQGFAAEVNGIQIMKPIPALEGLLARAQEQGIFGTKMRAVIRLASPVGFKAVVGSCSPSQERTRR